MLEPNGNSIRFSQRSLNFAPARLSSGGDAFFTSHIHQLANLSNRHAVPAVYQWREFVAAGDLMSYGASIAETHRLVGIYAGRILKGEKPANLAVQQATKVEFL
jgi:putative ABC transport system substrate-binding protein